MRLIVGLILIFAAAGLANAQAAYVTDTLRLGLHRAEDTSDRAFRTLESGQLVNVLERNRNYARVRLPDGTEGFVKAAYLVTEKPAKLVVAEAQAEVARIEQEIGELRESFARPAERIATLEQELESGRSALATYQQQLDEVNAINEDFVQRFEQYRNSLPMRWVGGAVAVCLLAGFLAGLWWTDYRSRKRHGGVRIY